MSSTSSTSPLRSGAAHPLASKRRVRRKACEGKVGHETQDYALIALQRSYDNGIPMNVYKCQFCPKWHVGHLSNRLKRARAWARGQ